MTRKQVAFFALFMGLLGLIFFYIGISMGWLYVRTPHPSQSNFSHTYGLIGIHGSRPRFSRGTNRTLCELEESEQAQAPALMWRWHDSRYLGAAHGVGASLLMSSLLHANSLQWVSFMSCYTRHLQS